MFTTVRKTIRMTRTFMGKGTAHKVNDAIWEKLKAKLQLRLHEVQRNFKTVQRNFKTLTHGNALVYPGSG